MTAKKYLEERRGRQGGVLVFSEFGKRLIEGGTEEGRKERGKRKRRAHQFKVFDHRSPLDPSLVSFEPPEFWENDMRGWSDRSRWKERRRGEREGRDSRAENPKRAVTSL